MSFSFKNQAFLCLIFSIFSLFGTKNADFKKKILISKAALNLCKKKFEKTEGFLAGTLVKTAGGYRPIESLAVGEEVTSFDVDGQLCQSKIVQVSKKTVKGFVALQIDEKVVCVASDQRFFLPEKGDWIKAKNIALSNRFLSKTDDVASASEIKLVQESVDVYSISLDEHHNFCVTESDILVHNLAPVVAAGVTIAFDATGVEFLSAFFSVGVFGVFCNLFGWEKSEPDKFNRDRSPAFYRKKHEFSSSNNCGSYCGGSGGTGPNKNDDDDSEKKKRNTDRAENMYEWFEKHSTGQKYRDKFERVPRGKNGEWRAKETFKPHDDVTIEKGDEIYLDRGIHKGDHFEWFNKHNNKEGVLNLDLTRNVPKSLVAIKENRTNN